MNAFIFHVMKNKLPQSPAFSLSSTQFVWMFLFVKLSILVDILFHLCMTKTQLKQL